MKKAEDVAREIRAKWETHWASRRPVNWNTAEELEDLDARITQALESYADERVKDAIRHPEEMISQEAANKIREMAIRIRELEGRILFWKRYNSRYDKFHKDNEEWLCNYGDELHAKINQLEAERDRLKEENAGLKQANMRLYYLKKELARLTQAAEKRGFDAGFKRGTQEKHNPSDTGEKGRMG